VLLQQMRESRLFLVFRVFAKLQSTNKQQQTQRHLIESWLSLLSWFWRVVAVWIINRTSDGVKHMISDWVAHMARPSQPAPAHFTPAEPPAIGNLKFPDVVS
jgi:hypothetical protein